MPANTACIAFPAALSASAPSPCRARENHPMIGQQTRCPSLHRLNREPSELRRAERHIRGAAYSSVRQIARPCNETAAARDSNSPARYKHRRGCAPRTGVRKRAINRRVHFPLAGGRGVVQKRSVQRHRRHGTLTNAVRRATGRRDDHPLIGAFADVAGTPTIRPRAPSSWYRRRALTSKTRPCRPIVYRTAYTPHPLVPVSNDA